MHAFVEEAKTAFDGETTFVKIDDYEFLKSQKVPYLVPWIMPEGNNYGSARASNELAIKNGLTFRDLKQSMKDIHSWWNSSAMSQERRDQFELKPEPVFLREKEIIAAWKELKIEVD